MHPTSDNTASAALVETPANTAVSSADATADPAGSAFRLGFVPGVNPAKWIGMWRERRSEELQLIPVDVLDDGAQVHAGAVHAALVRLPVNRTDLDAIALYEEVPVVIVPLDHLITAADDVTISDLADEVVLHPLDDLLQWPQLPGTPARERPATTADAVALVAAGVGVLVAPMSLARLHHRRDLTFRPLTDGPTSGISLVWTQYEVTEQIEAFIGIVRGRTPNSSRGQLPETGAPERETTPAPQPTSRNKTGRPGGRGKTGTTLRGLPPRNPGRKPKPGKAGRKGKGKGSR